MKQNKRIISLLLAVVMVVTSCLVSLGVSKVDVQASMAETSTQIVNSHIRIADGVSDSRLLLFFNTHDYTGISTRLFNLSWFENEYDTLSKIDIYKEGVAQPVTLKSILADTTNAYYNIWGENGSIAFDIDNAYNGKTITKIVVKAGAAFPSYQNNTTKTYVVEKETVIASNSLAVAEKTGEWTISRIDRQKTNVTAIQTRKNSDTDKRLFFELSANDYSGAVNADLVGANATWYQGYNTLDNILVYTSDTEFVTLRQIYANQAHFNLWGSGNVFCIAAGANHDGTTVKKVVVKAGCEFPSYKYEVAKSATDKVVYVVGQETIFTSTSQASGDNVGNWTRTVIAPEVEVEISVDAIQTRKNSNTDKRLFLQLGGTDYNTAPGNICLSDKNATWYDGYNTLDNIWVYTDDTSYVTLRDIYAGQTHYNLWGSTNVLCLAMGANHDGTNVKKVVIKEGCEFPDYTFAYAGTGEEKTVYVVKEETAFTSTSQASADNVGSWTRTVVDTSVPYETEVATVVSGHNENQVAFTLSANDYTVATGAFSASGAKESEYNFLEKIEIHTKTAGVKALKDLYNFGNSWYKMWGTPDVISIDLSIADDEIEKIVIPAETVFPSYAYASGAVTKRFGYKTTEEKVFINETDTTAANPFGASGYAWKLYVAPTGPIALTPSVKFNRDNLLTFEFVEIATPTDENTSYNFTAVDSNSVYTYNGQPSAAGMFMNMFGLYMQTDQMKVGQTTAEVGDIIKVSGVWTCSKDNLEYDFGTLEYRWNGNSWVQYVAPIQVTTEVVHNRNDLLTLKFDKFALPTDGGTSYNFTAADTLAVYTYNGQPSVTGMFMNMFGLYMQVDQMTGNAQTKANIGDEIIVGGLWSCDNGSVYDIPTTKYTWDGAMWTLSDKLEWIDTDIANIQVRGENDVLLVFPMVHDYASAGSTVPINNMDATYAVLENITVYKSDAEYKTLAELVTMEGSTGERYYNIWGENGCFSIDMPNGWGGEEIEKIVFKKGCQFPAYETTNGGSQKKVIYRLQDDVIFVSRTPAEDNFSWERTFASTSIETTVTGVQVIGTDGNVRLVVSLGTNDYDGAEYSYDISAKFADYNTLKKVMLYADGTPISLADAVSGEEVFLNLWGNVGTVSYALKTEYNLNAFDEVEFLSGCEFPAYSYALPNAQNKIAYTLGSTQKLDITRTSFAVIYYDESGTEIFRDMAESGTAFELRAVQPKAGYIGNWEGLTYTVMPAQNIEYYLSYEKAEIEEDTPTEPIEPEEPIQQEEEEKSPVTGDINRIVLWSVLMACALTAVLVITKRKWNSIGE